MEIFSERVRRGGIFNFPANYSWISENV